MSAGALGGQSRCTSSRAHRVLRCGSWRRAIEGHDDTLSAHLIRTDLTARTLAACKASCCEESRDARVCRGVQFGVATAGEPPRCSLFSASVTGGAGFRATHSSQPHQPAAARDARDGAASETDQQKQDADLLVRGAHPAAATASAPAATSPPPPPLPTPAPSLPLPLLPRRSPPAPRLSLLYAPSVLPPWCGCLPSPPLPLRPGCIHLLHYPTTEP